MTNTLQCLFFIVCFPNTPPILCIFNNSIFSGHDGSFWQLDDQGYYVASDGMELQYPVSILCPVLPMNVDFWFFFLLSVVLFVCLFAFLFC